MASGMAAVVPAGETLSNASVDRLACLVRHWTWADEALLHDEETLGRLRRVHEAFGEALREERMSREIDSLDH